MKLYKEFQTQEKIQIGQTPKGKPKWKTKTVEKLQEVNVKEELQSALSQGGIEQQIESLQKAIVMLARKNEDAIPIILDLASPSLEYRQPIYDDEGSFHYDWRYKIID